MDISRKVQKTSNNQYIITIPKAFAEVLNYSKSTILEFNLNNNLEIILKKVNSQIKTTHIKIQITKSNQFIITIPKALAQLLDLTKGTKIKFKINSKMNLMITK